MTRIIIEWRERVIPLAPLAAVAEGAAAAHLRARLLASPDDELSRLRGVSAPGLLCIQGDDLPWADGVEYLGLDPHAPQLLLPTLWEPSCPVALAARAWVRAAGPGARPPWAVVRGSRRLVCLADARPLGRDALTLWSGA